MLIAKARTRKIVANLPSCISMGRYFSSYCKNIINLNLVELRDSGDLTRAMCSVPKIEFCLENGLQVRDLRQLEISRTSMPILPPSILSRGKSIFVNLVYTKAIIRRDCVKFIQTGTVIDEAMPTFFNDILNDLQEQIKSSSKKDGSFEFMVLECLLDHTSAALSRRINYLQSGIDELLIKLERTVDRDSLKSLLLYNKELTKFQSIATAIRSAIDDLLESDSDMSSMYLSRTKFDGETADSFAFDRQSSNSDIPNKNFQDSNNTFTVSNEINSTIISKMQPNTKETEASFISHTIPTHSLDLQLKPKPIQHESIFSELSSKTEHEELELLLEHFMRITDEIVGQTEDLLQNIQSTEGISNIVLDSQRNALLRLELRLTICGFSMGFAGLGASIFGMNLQSNFEHHPHAFYFTLGSLFSLSGIALSLCWRKMNAMIRESQ